MSKKIAMELHVVAKYKMPEKRIQVFSEIIYMQSIYNFFTNTIVRNVVFVELYCTQHLY